MKQKNFETLLYSTIGVGVMFVVMIASYIVISALKVRVDVTADKAHTLSPGTKKILDKLDSRVTVRFYCTQGDNAMPPALRTYAQHVEDLLNEYKEAAKGKLILQKFDPKPDSDAEDSARLNGVEGQATGPFGANKIYLGVVVSIFDEQVVLPFLSPTRERLLEYDLSRSISRVANRTPPVVGIMSALPVFGEPKSNPMMLDREDRGKEPWAFVTELRKDFTVKSVPMTATKIDDAIKVLVVVHPRNISDAAQFAIDQFVLRGGKLLAFLDPHAFFDQSHDQQGHAFQVYGDVYGQSSLDKLLKAWGLTMDVDKVAADTSFGNRSKPTLLIITRAGIDENDVATSQIDNLVMPFAGVFTGKPAEGLKEIVLVKCSVNSQLVDTLVSTAASEQILRDFKPANIPYALAVHLTGKFKTAFPDGPPKESAGLPGITNALKASRSDGEVVLVADSDMLNDKAAVSVQNLMGRRVVKPMNGNLNFLQSLVEQFSGDDDLISSRSRASMNRPFTRVKDMEARAGRQWQEKIQVMETQQRETERKIADLQAHREGNDEQKLILSPEQQEELEKYQKSRAEVAKQLKQVRKNLRNDTDAMEFWTKVANIGAMPLVVAVSGLVLAGIKRKRRSAR